MTTLLIALFLMQPAMVVKSPAARENRCYMMRILPVPKDFQDPMVLRTGPPSAKLEEVRPNCWARPSTEFLSAPKPAPSLSIPTEKH